ncbi:RNA polymerase sigma factor [Shimia sp. MMG029]|uniref:RNA polymerase sigma factor n=1 Tax=Shimia sp. MMG029 TaxID=3021978 RepID=UPI0022FE79E8|nr:RNA polymerase sigma factor [Shimia sp. MMG029]MDA5556447.1 RNA polymerase sigma factor [Shimia sp. MMG029]
MTHPTYATGLDTFVDERDRLIAAAYRIVDSHAVAEELVQESWIRWHAKQYPAEHTRPLLLRIVKNLAIDWHRKRRIEFEAIETQRLLDETALDAERVVLARQQLHNVIKLVETLPPKVRLAFRYSRIEGMTLKEVGKRLGVSESRASQLVSDAIVRLVVVFED